MKSWPCWFSHFIEKTHFLRRFPQYVSVLGRLRPVAARMVGSMGISLENRDHPDSPLTLLINRSYFDKHPQYLVGILLHEIHHFKLGHLTNRRLHSVENIQAMEIAMEITANEFIKDPSPPGYQWNDFDRYGIRPFQSTIERYDLLVKAVEEKGLKLPNLTRIIDTHRLGENGFYEGIRDALDRRSEGRRSITQCRGLGLPTPPERIQEMRFRIEQHLKGKSVGQDQKQHPGRRARQDVRKPTFWFNRDALLPWRQLLVRIFKTRRCISPSYLRPNRRFQDRIGEIPGRIRSTSRPNLLAGIDTSGSMSEEALGLITHEIDRLARHANITIAECDAAIHRVYTMKQPLKTLHGGGDTDFNPVFSLQAHGAKSFEGIVYFTDGKGKFPERPSLLPTLWVLTNDDTFNCNWGHVVRLPVRNSHLKKCAIHMLHRFEGLWRHH